MFGRCGRRSLLLLAPLAVALVAFLYLSPRPSSADVDPGTIPGRYIVVLNDNVDAQAAAASLDQTTNIQPDAVYTSALNGFAAVMSDEDASQLADNANVVSVKPDRAVSIDLHQNNFQTLTEGPDRIDLEQNTTANVTGLASGGTTLNVQVAVFDTGIVTTHPELNVAGGKGFAGANCGDAGYEDDHGHGTHVSGTIGAKDNDKGLVGVAPGAGIWALKVLDHTGFGEDSCIIAAIDWLTARKQEFNDGAGDGDPGINVRVANMSLGGDTNDSPGDDLLCQAIDRSTAAGITYAVAAGNAARDVDGAQNYAASSPAHCLNAVTVSAFADFDGKPGALSSETWGNCGHKGDDEFACFSNYGPAVDIAAPGVDIVSTYLTGGCGANVPCYATLSGTSMATPHIAGAIALFETATNYNGPANGAGIIAALTAAGYTRPQNAPCGITGDPDDVHEPILYAGTGCHPDADLDGVPDATDDCIDVVNAGQENSDTDPLGDACDNCPTTNNANQANVVHPNNPLGDACEDPDGDSVFDATDNCPDTANPSQANAKHPLTQLGDACEDPDGDSVFDANDNCPDWQNTQQLLPPWPIPAGDLDCDGFPSSLAAATRAAETTIGTSVSKHCASTPTANDESGADAMPMDFNDNQIINGQDVGFLAAAYNRLTSGGPYGNPPLPGARYDFTGNGIINGQDVGVFGDYYNTRCA
jgi:subtilisin